MANTCLNKLTIKTNKETFDKVFIENEDVLDFNLLSFYSEEEIDNWDDDEVVFPEEITSFSKEISWDDIIVYIDYTTRWAPAIDLLKKLSKTEWVEWFYWSYFESGNCFMWTVDYDSHSWFIDYEEEWPHYYYSWILNKDLFVTENMPDIESIWWNYNETKDAINIDEVNLEELFNDVDKNYWNEEEIKDEIQSIKNFFELNFDE